MQLQFLDVECISRLSFIQIKKKKNTFILVGCKPQKIEKLKVGVNLTINSV